MWVMLLLAQLEVWGDKTPPGWGHSVFTLLSVHPNMLAPACSRGLALEHGAPCAPAETHRDTLSVQRATATTQLRAEVKFDTCAQLSEAGSYTSAVLRRSLPPRLALFPPKT